MYRLIIKGDNDAAEKAVLAHNFRSYVIPDLPEAPRFAFREAYVDVPAVPGTSVQLVKWMCEGHDRAPYNDGQLLFYFHLREE